jgi:hypothetical protein
MGGNHRPSAPFCRELLTLSQFVMRYFVPADGTFSGDDRAAFMRAGLSTTLRTDRGRNSAAGPYCEAAPQPRCVS